MGRERGGERGGGGGRGRHRSRVVTLRHLDEDLVGRVDCKVDGSKGKVELHQGNISPVKALDAALLNYVLKALNGARIDLGLQAGLHGFCWTPNQPVD
jgi:hypothetical protein